MGIDSRLAKRVRIYLKVISKVDKLFKKKFALADGTDFEASIVDISTSGIGLVLRYFLPRGLVIELTLDGALFGLKGPMKIKGEVRHCKNVPYPKYKLYRVGIKFISVPKLYKKAISELISKLEKRKEPRLSLS